MKKTLTQVLLDLRHYDRRLHYLARFSPATLARIFTPYNIEVDEKGYLNYDAEENRRNHF